MKDQIRTPTFAASLTVMILVSASLSINAATLAEFEFSDPVKTQAFRDLTEQLRCLVCQNESLAASQAELAQDLRKKIYEMMLAGKTNTQIIDFLVARYGDFILYNPPIKPSTYLLWYGPLLFCGIALVILFRILLQQHKIRDTDLSEQERSRLASLLVDSSHSQVPPP